MIGEGTARGPSFNEIIHEYSRPWRSQPCRWKQEMDWRRGWLLGGQDPLQAARNDLRRDLPGWHPDNSRTVLRRQDQGIKAVDPEPPRELDLAIGLPLRLEAPFRSARRIRKHQTVVLAQIFGGLRDAAASGSAKQPERAACAILRVEN